MIARHGGRYLTKGGSRKILESGFQIATESSDGEIIHWHPERVVIIEFPDMESRIMPKSETNSCINPSRFRPLLAGFFAPHPNPSRYSSTKSK
jgi:hypothetical protein